MKVAKNIVSKPVKLSYVLQIVKKPEDKDYVMYQADIKEYSDLNIYLDEIYKIRGLDKTSRVPERLVFEYKCEGRRAWPLYLILKEGFKTLSKIYSKMRIAVGFTLTAKAEILKRINEIRSSCWSDNGALPRKMTIPFTSKRILHQPYHWGWMKILWNSFKADWVQLGRKGKNKVGESEFIYAQSREASLIL